MNRREHHGFSYKSINRRAFMYTRSGINRTLALLTLLLFTSAAIAGGKNETAVTVWLVIFNDPSACVTEPCTEHDIFVGNEAHPGDPMYSPAMPGVCYLGGQSVQANRRMTISGRFAAGTDHGCFWPMGLMYIDEAEIHSILQRHGWALKSGDGLEDQIGEFLGNCNPTAATGPEPENYGSCADTQFTIHQPADAVAGVSVSDGYFFPPDMFTPPAMVEGANSMLTREGYGVRFSWHTRLAEDD
jgi:hypothetical protein